MFNAESLLFEIRAILPHAVGMGLRTADDSRPITLSPTEEQCLSPRAVARRRLQFRLGRAAARDALAEIGAGGGPISKGKGGEPVWPEGFIGSITHTAEIGVAVAARRTEYQGLGIDLEVISPRFDLGIARQVCTTAELDWIQSDAAHLRTAAIFSAKEAIFKAVYPLERVRLDFKDAELTWGELTTGFSARLLRQCAVNLPPGSMLNVNCWLSEKYVFAAVCL